MAIAKNKFLEWARTTKRELELFENTDYSQQGFDSIAEDIKNGNDYNDVMRSILAECVSKMSKRCCQILTQFYYNNMNLDEIISATPSFHSKNALKTSKNKCLNTAKECKNKKEFARKYYGAYIKSLKEGWMEDIDKIFNVDYEFEKQLCDDYKNGCTLLDLKSKYNIGLRRITKIMSKYGMKPRNKGGFMGNKHDDIKPKEGFHFVAIDKNANFETLDYLNKGGNLTTHIRNYYGVDVPSLYYRKKYRLENGKEWWEQWFDIKEVKNKETKKCPFCDWKTIDVDNKSGALEMHLRREHNISRDEYLKLYYSN